MPHLLWFSKVSTTPQSLEFIILMAVNVWPDKEPSKLISESGCFDDNSQST